MSDDTLKANEISKMVEISESLDSGGTGYSSIEYIKPRDQGFEMTSVGEIVLMSAYISL